MLDRSPCSSRGKIAAFRSDNDRLHFKNLRGSRASSGISSLDVGSPALRVGNGIVIAGRGIDNFLRLNADIEEHEAIHKSETEHVEEKEG